MIPNPYPGIFIVFEGIDGSGKSTQITILAKTIQALDKYTNILLTREPTNNPKISHTYKKS